MFCFFLHELLKKHLRNPDASLSKVFDIDSQINHYNMLNI